MDQQHPGRHRKLLKYVRRLVAGSCPSYLRSEQDDVVQTVMVRLHAHAEGLAEELERCSDELRAKRDGEALAILRRCLREIGKAWHRTKTRWAHELLKKCHVSLGDATMCCGDVAADVEKARAWLLKRDGKEIFSKVWVKRGVHWAILDVRKKHRSRAEVPADENDGGTYVWDSMQDQRPEPQTGSILDEISSCLRELKKTLSRATYMSLLGYRQREIAQYLELTIPQAETRIRRGKAGLRKCLRRKGVTP